MKEDKKTEIRKAQLIPTLLLLGLVVVLPALTPARASGDFTISANPSNLGTVFADTPYNITITLTSTGGFSGSVSLSGHDFNNFGVDITFTPTSVNVPANGSAQSTLTLTIHCSSPSPRSPVTVLGTSGSLAHQTTVKWGIVYC